MQFKKSIFLILLSFFFAATGSVYAAGATFVDEHDSGTPSRWAGDTFEWYADNNSLSAGYSHDQAVALIKTLFGLWTEASLTDANKQNVKTTTIKTDFKGNLGKKIANCNSSGSTEDSRRVCNNDEEDIYDFYNDDCTVEKRSIVIFDKSGDIMKELDYESNPGITGVVPDQNGGICRAFVILNGAMLSNKTITAEKFRAAMLHELGHALNLDHSYVNHDISPTCSSSGNCNFLPTMFPVIVSKEQAYLSYDDIISISSVYPSPAFENSFDTITGKIFDSNGLALKQANIVAYRADGSDQMSRIDARSFVSGASNVGCTGDAGFSLRGLLPGHKYQVGYESINPKYVGFSGFQPLPDKIPPQFAGGDVLDSTGGSAVFIFDGGGQSTALPDIAGVKTKDDNICATSGVGDNAGDSGSTSGGETGAAQSSSKCSLLPSGGAWYFPVTFLILSIMTIFIRRRLNS